ncbi:PH domain-containing protein [Streptomyces sp. NPDC091292]|uniref:PH domain-containing protein n=1 Tax=Streptomyces sp. NPDC091292 TaxID=3365991 RepID=UPI0038241FC3
MGSSEQPQQAVVVPVLESRIALEWGCVLLVVGVVTAPALALPLGLLDEPLLFCLTPVAVGILLHFGLRRRFVVRVDDSGVTVVRPWKSRHVPWSQIRGLCVQRHHTGSVEDGDWWKIRLVAERPGAGAVHGPVIVALDAPHTAPDRLTPAEHARLARHGLVFAQFTARDLGLTGHPAPCDDEVAYMERALALCGGGGEGALGR